MFLCYLFYGLIIFVVIFISYNALARYFSLPCPHWIKWMVEMDNPFTKTNRAQTIIATLDLKDGMSVADIGCGPGRLTIPLAKAVGVNGKVLAVDIQQEMLDTVKEKALKENLTNIDFLKIDIGQENLNQDSFDRILLVTVLGEIPKQENALKNIYDSLKPDGILSITEVIFDPHFQTRNKVRKLAEKIGFKEKGFWGNYIAYTIHFQKA